MIQYPIYELYSLSNLFYIDLFVITSVMGEKEEKIK